MDEPKFFYQRSPKYPGYVAVMGQFLPTFEAKQPQEIEDIEYQDDGEEIEEEDIEPLIKEKNEAMAYYFVVDRSGSMSGKKMDITK